MFRISNCGVPCLRTMDAAASDAPATASAPTSAVAGSSTSTSTSTRASWRRRRSLVLLLLPLVAATRALGTWWARIDSIQSDRSTPRLGTPRYICTPDTPHLITYKAFQCVGPRHGEGVRRGSALAAGGAGDKERVQRLMRLKKIKDSGGSYESLLNEVRTPTVHVCDCVCGRTGPPNGS